MESIHDWGKTDAQNFLQRVSTKSPGRPFRPMFFCTHAPRLVLKYTWSTKRDRFMNRTFYLSNTPYQLRETDLRIECFICQISI